MKKKMVIWIGLVSVLFLLMAACSGATPSPQAEELTSSESVITEEPEPTESVVTEEPTAMSVPTEEPTENVTVEEPKITGLSTGEMAPDLTLPDRNGNMVNLAETLQGNEQVVLVFYRGFSCSPCMRQLSEIENDRARYEEKDAQVIAIAVQSEVEAGTSARVSNVQFPILADSEHAVAEAYGVYEVPEYEGLSDLSTPSVFIINKDRQIVWSEISHIDGGGCGSDTDRVPSQTILEHLQLVEETVSSLNPVTTPGGEQVGESELERESDKIVLNFGACCVTPGNAYTAWWLIGDVTKPMSAVKSLLATGFVAEDEQVKLELELKASLATIKNPLEGVRLAVLDHGEATGDPFQLSTPGGGCTTMPCPVPLETSHAAPK
jgi:peroxiredoxin